MVSQILRTLSGVIVIAIGIFMVSSYPVPQTPPFCSGVVFIILGLNLWIANCPLIHGLRKCKSGSCSS